MEIHLNQADIETAIKRYVAEMGISRPIDNVDFTVRRQGGNTVEAEIKMVDPSTEARTADQAAGTDSTTGAPTESKPATDQTEEAEPEPAKTEPPFEPDADADAVNDSEEEEPTSESKSLFS